MTSAKCFVWTVGRCSHVLLRYGCPSLPVRASGALNAHRALARTARDARRMILAPLLCRGSRRTQAKPNVGGSGVVK
jgi:hypothetical protein